MGHNNKEKIIRVYFENPGKKFTIRELSKLTRIPRSTLQNKLNSLKKDKLITSENIAAESLFFKIKKTNYYIEELFKSGLMDFLIKNLNPSCIILFGSFRKADSVKISDIDLFVESFVKKKLDLSKYERKLGHKIDLFVEHKLSKLQDNLFNNVINGIKLYGNLKLK